jgi:hypothetical protein
MPNEVNQNKHCDEYEPDTLKLMLTGVNKHLNWTRFTTILQYKNFVQAKQTP